MASRSSRVAARVDMVANRILSACDLTTAFAPPIDRRTVTLHRILVHMLAETSRHAGHADIVRELVDGAAGWRADARNLPSDDRAWWAAHRDRVERAARDAEQASGRFA